MFNDIFGNVVDSGLEIKPPFFINFKDDKNLMLYETTSYFNKTSVRNIFKFFFTQSTTTG